MKKWLKIIGIILLVFIGYKILISFSSNGFSERKMSTSSVLDKDIGGANLAQQEAGVSPATSSKLSSPLGASDSSEMAEAPGEPMAENETNDELSSDETTDKKIKKDGLLKLKVENSDEAHKQIGEIAKANGGEIFSSNFYEQTQGVKNGTVTIKIPVDKFEQAFEEIKKVATQVIKESTTSTDITEQYVDLQAQLKNKKAEEETFVRLLERSGEIKDVLSVTKEISRVRGQIERLEGKIKFLESQTDMSTITIELSEDVEISPITDDWRPLQVIKKSFKQLARNTQDFIDFIIHLVIVVIPTLIPYLLVFWIIYWIAKKIFRRFKKKPADEKNQE